jgi:hypothetical protein
LTRIACSRGLDALEADVLRRDASRLRVFESAGLPLRAKLEGPSPPVALSMRGGGG